MEDNGNLKGRGEPTNGGRGPGQDIGSNLIAGPTGLEATEELLRDRQSEYQELVELLPEPIFEADRGGHLTFVNRATLHTFGYSPEELRSSHLRLFLSPQDRARGDANLQRILGGEDIGIQEYQFRRKDGSLFAGLVHTRPIIRRGNVHGLKGVVVDISARKQAEIEREHLLVREQALARIGRALVSEIELERVADVVVHQSLKVLEPDAVGLWLANPLRRELNLLAHDGFRFPTKHRLFSYDAALATARAAKTGHIQTVADLAAYSGPAQIDYNFALQTGFRSLLSVPLTEQGRVVGVITYFTRAPRRYSPDDLDFNSTLADLFAVAIERARLHQHLRRRERQVGLLLRSSNGAHETERVRLRDEVHDGVVDALKGASGRLRALAGLSDVPGELHASMQSTALMVDEAVRQLEEIIDPLAPASLGLNAWPGDEPITVLIVDDSALGREGLRTLLETEESVRVIGEAVDGAEALKLVAELKPRAVLMDLRMPILDGIEATCQIKARHAGTAVIVMTAQEDVELVVNAVRAGANGYLQKDASRELLVHAIGAVAAGGMVFKDAALRQAIDGLAPAQPVELRHKMPAGALQLSEREQKVLKLLAEGRTNREIGNALGLAEITVKKHVQSIVCKLGVSDRTQAATTALRLGLIR